MRRRASAPKLLALWRPPRQAATHEEAARILDKALPHADRLAGSCWKSILMPAAPRLARLSRKAPGSDDVCPEIFAVEEAGVALERSPPHSIEFQVEASGELHLVLKHFFRNLSVMAALSLK